MAVDPMTIQKLAQQRANEYRIDGSRPKDNPYAGLVQREESYLNDPMNAPGVSGFQREIQTQGNAAAEKLRNRIAGIQDPLAVGREMARMDQQVRNQLAVYLSQQQQQARQNLLQATQGSAGWMEGQQRIGLSQQQLDLSREQMQSDLALRREQMAQQQAYQQQQLDLARQQLLAQTKQQKRSSTQDWARFALDLGKAAYSVYSGNVPGAVTSVADLLNGMG